MSDERVALVRSWLVTGEKPAHIIATDATGANTRVAWRTGETWIGLARTIVALDSVRLQAFDTQNNLLRATTMVDLERVAEPEPEPAEPTRVSVIDPSTLGPSEAMLVRFGELLANAYESSSRTAWDTAFGKMVEIVNIFADRAEKTEARLQRMESMFNRELSNQIEQYQAGANDGGLLGQVLGAYMQGAAQGAAVHAQPTNGAAKPTNGKGQQPI